MTIKKKFNEIGVLLIVAGAIILLMAALNATPVQHPQVRHPNEQPLIQTVKYPESHNNGADGSGNFAPAPTPQPTTEPNPDETPLPVRAVPAAPIVLQTTAPRSAPQPIIVTPAVVAAIPEIPVLDPATDPLCDVATAAGLCNTGVQYAPDTAICYPKENVGYCWSVDAIENPDGKFDFSCRYYFPDGTTTTEYRFTADTTMELLACKI